MIVIKHWRTTYIVDVMEYCKTGKIVRQVQDDVHP
jgi:hypothetical protein